MEIAETKIGGTCPSCNSDFIFSVGPSKNICSSCKTIFDTDEAGRWITIRGTHVFIKSGETVKNAMKRQFNPKKAALEKAKKIGKTPLPLTKSQEKEKKLKEKEGLKKQKEGEKQKKQAEREETKRRKSIEKQAASTKTPKEEKDPYARESQDEEAQVQKFIERTGYDRETAERMIFGQSKGDEMRQAIQERTANLEALGEGKPWADRLSNIVKVALQLMVAAQKGNIEKFVGVLEDQYKKIKQDQKITHEAKTQIEKEMQGLFADIDAYRERFKLDELSDMEINDSFIDLVSWVMATMNIEDEKEAKIIAWKIINSKRGTGKTKAKPKAKKPEIKPQPKPKVSTAKEKAIETVKKQVEEFKSRYKKLQEAFERANDFHVKNIILGQIVDLRNQIETFKNENMVLLGQKSGIWSLRYLMDQKIKQNQANLGKWFAEHQFAKDDKIAEEALLKQDKQYWSELKDSIEKAEQEIESAREEKKYWEQQKREFALRDERWGLHENRLLKRAKADYNDVVRKQALEKFLLQVKAPAQFDFDKKALMFTKSSKNLKANKEYLKDVINDYKSIPARFRGFNSKYTDNSGRKIEFVWKVPGPSGILGMLGFGKPKLQQRTGGQHNGRNGQIYIATERKLREGFKDSVLAHEIGHAIHGGGQVFGLGGISLHNNEQWGKFNDIFYESRNRITQYGDGQLYNPKEFFAVLFAEYATGKVDSNFRGPSLRRPKFEKYYLQSYPKAWNWFKKNFTTKGFKGHQIILDYEKKGGI